MLSLQEAAEKYLEQRLAAGEIGTRTAEVQRSRLRPLLRAAGDDLAAGELDREVINRWRAEIGTASPAMRRACQSTLRRFCAWLVAEEHLGTDPTAGLARVREPRRTPRALPADLVAKVIARSDSNRDRAIVWLMVGCGLRCAEVANLDVDHYDRARQVLAVRGKNGDERTVPVAGEVQGPLEAWLEERQSHPMAHLPALILPDPDHHGGRPGAPRPRGNMTAHSVSALMRRLMVDAGVHTPRGRPERPFPATHVRHGHSGPLQGPKSRPAAPRPHQHGHHADLHRPRRR